MKKLLLWLAIGGVTYYAIEGIWRHITCSEPPHIAMMAIGGLCLVLVGGINQVPAFYHLSMRVQAILGSLIVLAVELAAGLVFNVWLGWGLWDYSHMPLNFMGQICALYWFLWLLLMPFAIWLEDRLCWLIDKAYGRDAVYDYTLGDAYHWAFFGGDGKKDGQA